MAKLMIGSACIKAFVKKVGTPKTKLTVVAAFTPELARALKVHSAVFTQDNTPKQEIVEVELNVQKSAPFDFRLAVPDIKDVLLIPACTGAEEWIAKRKGSTKRGQASRLLLEFKVLFTGAAGGVFDWLEKYGQAIGELSLDANGGEQQELRGEDVAAAAAEAQRKAGKGKANGAAAAGSTSTVQ